MHDQHVWEVTELEFETTLSMQNPYVDLEVWVDLKGPGFNKRIYGYWDGGRRYVVRVLATAAGTWHWEAGSSVSESGISGKGEFKAVAWSDANLAENPCRRGHVRPTSNGHGFEYADGTPLYYLADTWWATPTFRYPWVDDSQPKPEWAPLGFQELVARRKSQGFNGIAMLAVFPHWANDGHPSTISLSDGLPVRHAWQSAGSAFASGEASAKDMYNEGGRPFEFPGRVPEYEDVVPDFDRLNPEYFRYMDRKVAYLNEQGMIPFIETSRRDCGAVWKRYYDFPESYARFYHYLVARYGAYNTLLSPIHFDAAMYTIDSREYNEPANLAVDRWGHPPFGNLVGTNSAPSSLLNFGGPDEARWLTFHQIGNSRPHDNYWYLTEIFRAQPKRPALNGEPYYPGFPDDNPVAPTEKAARFCRSGIYGSLLSGGLAGYIYGAEGMWGGNVEPESKYTIWDALDYQSGDQVRHVLEFLSPVGRGIADLVPEPELLLPSHAGPAVGYDGFGYAAYVPGKKLILLYLEQGAPAPVVRSLRPHTNYRLSWFDPRSGEWSESSDEFTTDHIGRTQLPAAPASSNSEHGDWGALLKAI